MQMVSILLWCSLLATTFGEDDKLPEAGSDKRRYLLHCSAEDNFVLQVVVSYQIGTLSEGSFTEYFKEVFSDALMVSASMGQSIGCGPEGTVYTSTDASPGDDGIQISIVVERTDKNPSEYRTEFLSPWSKLSYEASDSKAKISATLTWRDQGAQGRASGS